MRVLWEATAMTAQDRHRAFVCALIALTLCVVALAVLKYLNPK